MAETHLRDANVPVSAWDGRRFRWAENPENGMWASIVIEVERRGGNWVVVRLDRNREPVAETGFSEPSAAPTPGP